MFQKICLVFIKFHVLSLNTAAHSSLRIVVLHWEDPLSQHLFFEVQRENGFLTLAI